MVTDWNVRQANFPHAAAKHFLLLAPSQTDVFKGFSSDWKVLRRPLTGVESQENTLQVKGGSALFLFFFLKYSIEEAKVSKMVDGRKQKTKTKKKFETNKWF